MKIYRNFLVLIISIIGITLCGILYWRSVDKSYSYLQPRFMPWQCIGGCGAGGSGGAVSGVKWVGQGVSGGMGDLEVMPRFSLGRNFAMINIAPRVSYKLNWNTQIGLSLPISSKLAEIQFKSNQPPITVMAGGMGDIGIDVSRILGTQSQYSLSLSMTLPTGQYDIKRGPDAARYFLPNNLQMGTGVYGISLGASYTKDVNRGLWVADVGLSYPITMRLISGKNKFLSTYYNKYDTPENKTNKRFYYKFKPYGENDMGDYFPPAASVGFVYAYRGIPGYVHSVQVGGGFPLGVAWIHSETINKYDPVPDPDHKAWSLMLAYGVEFSHEKTPIYCGIGFPIHDKSPGDTRYDNNPQKKWDAPAWDDIMQQWIMAVGIKTALF